MLSHIIALVMLGLGILHPAGNVAGLSDLRPTTASSSPELRSARENGLSASSSAFRSFQSKLSTIRDEKKKAAVERLNTTLNDVNTKRTTSLFDYLNRVSGILTKVQTKTASLKASGKDTSMVDAATLKAQASIVAAKAAILAQAGKQYTATISSELNLKTDMGKTMSQEQSDLKNVRDLVIQAQKDVSGAVAILAKLLGEGVPKTATGSGGTR